MPHRFTLEGKGRNAQKLRVLARDDFRCLNPLCRRAGLILEIDHVVPRSQGGPDTDENLCALCRICHELKGQGILLVIPNGDGTFRFHDTRRVLTCETHRHEIDAGALVAVPTPAGGYRWIRAAEKSSPGGV